MLRVEYGWYNKSRGIAFYISDLAGDRAPTEYSEGVIFWLLYMQNHTYSAILYVLNDSVQLDTN